MNGPFGSRKLGWQWKKRTNVRVSFECKAGLKRRIGNLFFLVCVCVIDGRLLNLFLESNTTFVSLKEF